MISIWDMPLNSSPTAIVKQHTIAHTLRMPPFHYICALWTNFYRVLILYSNMVRDINCAFRSLQFLAKMNAHKIKMFFLTFVWMNKWVRGLCIILNDAIKMQLCYHLLNYWNSTSKIWAQLLFSECASSNFAARTIEFDWIHKYSPL